MLSTAQGLLALVHAGDRSPLIGHAAASLEKAQNADGGWPVRHSLVGEPNNVSITESTCYCMWALGEAGRTVSGQAISRGAAWLLGSQRSSGAWGASDFSPDAEVVATAFAVRILTGLGYAQAAARGAEWLRTAQRADGGWGYLDAERSGTGLPSSPAPTAHAIITLLAVGLSRDDPAVVRACAYLRQQFDPAAAEPWRSSAFHTAVDSAGNSLLTFHNFALPWVLVALGLAGYDLSDPLAQSGVDRLLQLQDPDGSWWCRQSDRQTRTVWTSHDSIFALRTVVHIGSTNLARW